jgi:ABC-type transport system involved in Fe-S cluster assembly fused permease/ATPase subunit
MENNEQSILLTPTGWDWVTTTHLVLIALFAIGAVLILIWGRHLRRKRMEADAEIEVNNEIVESETPREP